MWRRSMAPASPRIRTRMRDGGIRDGAAARRDRSRVTRAVYRVVTNFAIPYAVRKCSLGY
jgi:hypothetical protein